MMRLKPKSTGRLADRVGTTALALGLVAPFVPMRTPFIYNLRRDPYERATITSNSYSK